MYTIEMKTKCCMTDKQKDMLTKAVKEMNIDAECEISDMLCRISSDSGDLEKLSYFMGIAMGCSSANEVVQMQISYEKEQ